MCSPFLLHSLWILLVIVMQVSSHPSILASDAKIPLVQRPLQSDHTPQEDMQPPAVHLHCRICRMSPCVELTSTFCGHIFCHG